MTERPFRVLAIASHPVQYMSPIFRRMANHRRLDLLVAYCSLQGVRPAHDSEFNTSVQWDIPLLDGYEWVEVPNRGFGKTSFFRLLNPGIWRIMRRGNFDAVLCFTGYICASFWIAYSTAKLMGPVFIFGTDAISLTPRDGRKWKVALKKLFWPRLYSLADQVIVPSNGARDLMISLGIPHDRITLTPYSVDNDWWRTESDRVDRLAVRASWGADANSCVVLFSAKLQPWKRPLDLLHAFAKANVPNSILVFAGEGSVRESLQAEVGRLGFSDRVRFLGFVNQSQLPAVYSSSDVMVLPSEYEPFAVVVNEAACCGCPTIASDQVGAARDLIASVNPKFIFPVKDVEALASILRTALSDRLALAEFGRAAQKRMDLWSPSQNIEATIQAIEAAVSRTGGSPQIPA